MKPLQLLLGASALLSLMTAPTAAARPQSAGGPVDLRCEHLTSPLGIDNPAPRLSWRLDTDRQGARQTAYALRVGTDSVRVLRGKPDVWESGKRSSGTSGRSRRFGKPRPRPGTKRVRRKCAGPKRRKRSLRLKLF